MCTVPWMVPPPITAWGISPTAPKFVQAGAPTVYLRTADHGLKLFTPSSVRTRQ
jgi:hypothetical protein